MADIRLQTTSEHTDTIIQTNDMKVEVMPNANGLSLILCNDGMKGAIILNRNEVAHLAEVLGYLAPPEELDVQ